MEGLVDHFHSHEEITRCSVKRYALTSNGNVCFAYL